MQRLRSFLGIDHWWPDYLLLMVTLVCAALSATSLLTQQTHPERAWQLLYVATQGLYFGEMRMRQRWRRAAEASNKLADAAIELVRRTQS